MNRSGGGEQVALEAITEFYIGSRDFNGIPVVNLQQQNGLDENRLRNILRSLVETNKISLVFGDIHPNPHIKALPDEPVSDQLHKLDTQLSVHTCAYPTQPHLAGVVDAGSYGGRPYELELALGEAQLAFRAFDLSVLEVYRNDPRYRYETNDISGWISIHGDQDQPSSLAERDLVFLQTFGFCYDDGLNRAVAVFMTYLADLTPEHQQTWKARELSGRYWLHPDYDRQSRGQWGERISIFEAFTEELSLVNEMCELAYGVRLFKNTFKGTRPKAFSFLIRPTSSEFNDFVHTLDKMMSENLDKRFFAGHLPLEEEQTRKDGRVEVRQKGTIALLEQWLKSRWKTPDAEPMENSIAAFKEVRSLRQKPAHAVRPDEFDQTYFHEQRELMVRVYNAVRTLRLLLANHPNVHAADVKINEELYHGKIWTF